MQLFMRWSKKENSLARRLVAGLLAGAVFLGLIPLTLLIWLPRLGDRLGVPGPYLGTAGLIAGGILILVGFPIGFWTVLDQYVRARGTPLPILPTQRLLTDGPYAWSRNPMVFGTLCAYLGISLLANSWLSLLAVVLFGTLLIIYLKLVEEYELTARFGKPYQQYKQKTSFIIPWPRKGR